MSYELMYCLLCQDYHETSNECLRTIVCKKCGVMGHSTAYHLKGNVQYISRIVTEVSMKKDNDGLLSSESGLQDLPGSPNCSSKIDSVKRIRLDSNGNNPDQEKKRCQSCLMECKCSRNTNYDILSSKFTYTLVYVHIETFHSSKSSSTWLTQIGGCTEDQEFFRAIRPPGLTSYLGSYKLGGDLLKALHMTQEADDTFLFRSQFEVIVDATQKIVCVREKAAVKDFLSWLSKFENCILLGVDENTLSILKKKANEYDDRKYFKQVVGYSYWKRILSKLSPKNASEEDLEEYFSRNIGLNSATYTTCKDVAFILKHSVEVVRSFNNISSDLILVAVTCKMIRHLPRPLKVKYDRSTVREDLEVYSSFHPSVSTTISAEKMEQVTISSDSEQDEVKVQVDDYTHNEVECNEEEIVEIIDDARSDASIDLLSSSVNNVSGYEECISQDNPTAELMIDESDIPPLVQDGESEEIELTPQVSPRIGYTDKNNRQIIEYGDLIPTFGYNIDETESKRLKDNTGTSCSDSTKWLGRLQDTQPPKLTDKSNNILRPLESSGTRASIHMRVNPSDPMESVPIFEFVSKDYARSIRLGSLLVVCPLCPRGRTNLNVNRIYLHFDKVHKSEIRKIRFLRCELCSNCLPYHLMSNHLKQCAQNHANLIKVKK